MTGRRDRYILFLFLFAFTLRMWGVADMQSYGGDEGLIIPSLENYIENGRFKPDAWVHPPMTHLLLFGTVKVLGYNPYGWRMCNVLLGSLSVLVLMLLGKELYADVRIAVLAGAFFAIEPFHILFSRTIPGEIPAVFFFLAALYVTVRYVNGRLNSPVAAGLFAGLSIASKWYYLPSLFALLLFATAGGRTKNRWLHAAHMIAVFVILPLAVYLVAFYPWFSRGGGLSEFFMMQVDAYRELQVMTSESFSNRFLRSTISSPLTWFVRPHIIGGMIHRQGAFGNFFSFMGNFPVWLLAVPAVLYSAHAMFWRKDRQGMVPLALFAFTYLQLILVSRPLFLYSALIVLPFVYLAVAYFLVSLLGKWKSTIWPFRILMTATFVWGLYLYPFVMGWSIPLALYAPLISLGSFILR